MANGGKVRLTKQGKSYLIEFAGAALPQIDTIVEIEAASSVMNIEPVEISAQSFSYNKKVSASSNPDPRWKEINSINNGDWSGHSWSPAKEDKTPWAEVDLGKLEKISKAVIYENGEAVKAFELQYQKGETWKTIYKGTTIGSKAEINLSKFTAQKVRLVLKEFSQVPGIYEFVLL